MVDETKTEPQVPKQVVDALLDSFASYVSGSDFDNAKVIAKYYRDVTGKKIPATKSINLTFAGKISSNFMGDFFSGYDIKDAKKYVEFYKEVFERKIPIYKHTRKYIFNSIRRGIQRKEYLERSKKLICFFNEFLQGPLLRTKDKEKFAKDCKYSIETGWRGDALRAAQLYKECTEENLPHSKIVPAVFKRLKHIFYEYDCERKGSYQSIHGPFELYNEIYGEKDPDKKLRPYLIQEVKTSIRSDLRWAIMLSNYYKHYFKKKFNIKELETARANLPGYQERFEDYDNLFKT